MNFTIAKSFSGSFFFFFFSHAAPKARHSQIFIFFKWRENDGRGHEASMFANSGVMNQRAVPFRRIMDLLVCI